MFHQKRVLISALVIFAVTNLILLLRIEKKDEIIADKDMLIKSKSSLIQAQRETLDQQERLLSTFNQND